MFCLMKDFCIMNGSNIRIELTIDAHIFQCSYKYIDIEIILIRSRNQDLFEIMLVEISFGKYTYATIILTNKDMDDNYT